PILENLLLHRHRLNGSVAEIHEFDGAAWKRLVRREREHRRSNIFKIFGAGMAGPHCPHVPGSIGSRHYLVRSDYDVTPRHAKPHFAGHDAGEAMSGQDKVIN